MCRRIAAIFLAGLFAYFVVTIAGFVYLEWWQALLASAGTFLMLVLGGKYLVRYAFTAGVEGLMSGAFRMKGKVLHRATIQVHSVRPTDTPDDEADYEADDGEDREPPRPLKWFAFDVTVFPDSKRHSQMTMWDIDDLHLVPSDSPDGDGLDALGDEDGFGLTNTRIVGDDGEPLEFDDDKVYGPRRLRFAAGVPAGVRELKFRYYFETFGRIRLPDPLALPPAR
jgi:hypothetical protein